MHFATPSAYWIKIFFFFLVSLAKFWRGLQTRLQGKVLVYGMFIGKTQFLLVKQGERK